MAAAAVTLLTPAAVLIAYLVGSLALTGAQVIDDRPPVWRPVVDWPVFTVSPWITVLLAVGALASVVHQARRATVTRALVLTTLLGWAAASAGSSWFFALALPPAALVGSPLLGRSDHLIAAGIGVLVIAVLIVRLVTVGRSHDRLVRAGLLGSGVLRTPDDWDPRAAFTLDAPVHWHRIGSEVLPPHVNSSSEAPVSFLLAGSSVDRAPSASGEEFVVSSGTSVERSVARTDDVIAVSYVFSRNRGDDTRLDAIIRPSSMRSPGEVDALVATADTIAGTFRWRT
ncbi:hypothetical protein [Microcella flavibacter]|uniref:hypothetical protein n=1 Tax=Microcella flavibacter TaxID=1804990 RepID=UPI0014565E44|nr:hypothetical protein [Microcella flavibacter]